MKKIMRFFFMISLLFFFTACDSFQQSVPVEPESKPETTMSVSNQSFTNVENITWLSNNFENLAVGEKIEKEINAGSGYIYFNLKGVGIGLRTKELFSVSDAMQNDFIFTDNTSVMSEDGELTETLSGIINNPKAPMLTVGLTDITTASLSITSQYEGTYKIERAERTNYGIGSFVIIQENYTGQIGETTYTDSTLAPSGDTTGYVYRVQLTFRGNNSDYSDEKVISTTLDAPTLSLSLTDITTASLSITSQYEGTYKIERAEKSTENLIFTVLEENYPGKIGTIGYIDDTLAPRSVNTTYVYRVQLIFSGNSSNYSNEMEVTTILPVPVITAVRSSFTEITISINSLDIDSYQIECSENNGSFAVIATVNANDTYKHSIVLSEENKTNIYRVAFIYKGNLSAYSDEVSVTYTNPVIENFKIIENPNTSLDAAFKFEWSAVQYAQRYYIWESKDDNFDNATKVSGSITTNYTYLYFDAMTDLSETYYFWIQPEFSDGNSNVYKSTGVSGTVKRVAIAYSYPGTYSLSVPNSTTVTAYLTGAGGGGQGSGDSYNVSGGGGGAGSAISMEFNVSTTAELTITIGEGGQGGLSNANSYGDIGGDGGATTLKYGSTTFTAFGGKGGGSSGENQGGAGGTTPTYTGSVTNEFSAIAGGNGSVIWGGWVGTIGNYEGYQSGADGVRTGMVLNTGGNGANGFAHIIVSQN